jgi:putative nucleotidyltransferase with HDIG domain
MTKEKFQELTIAVLSGTATEKEISTHKKLVEHEGWAKELFDGFGHTHNLLTKTIGSLEDEIAQAPPSAEKLAHIFQMIEKQAPLKGSASEDKQIYANLVKQVKKLPTLPIILDAISQALKDEHTNVVHIEELLSGDQSLTTTVLRMANSARYGLPRRVYSLHQAVSLMGFDEIQQLVLTASVITFMDKSTPLFSLNNFWRHSIGVATATCSVAKDIGISDDYILYTTALLHDIGKVGNLLLDTKGYLEIIQHSLRTHEPIDKIEREQVFPEHTRMGEAICEHWGLPSMISQAVRYHHEPDIDKRPKLPEEAHHTIDCIYIADTLVRQHKFGHSGNDAPPELAPCIVERLDLHPIRLEQLKNNIHEDIGHTHGLLDLLPAQVA